MVKNEQFKILQCTIVQELIPLLFQTKYSARSVERSKISEIRFYHRWSLKVKTSPQFEQFHTVQPGICHARLISEL